MSGPMDVAGLISLLESADIQAGREVKELVLDNLRNNKDIWLVNALVDSYVLTRSPRCLEIITSVSEPHDKHVFDRLCDHTKGQHKLAAMSILATLVYKEPSWLHKIVRHNLMNVLLKCLKMDLDIPVLVSGLLVITALLPVVPVAIKDHLPHLFEVFSRLATLCLRSPAPVPELYRYHLQVGVYCLHHRLYSMYPYHFLTYLRNIYSKQEEQEVFEHIIKPMVDKVRLHPLLFTTTREKEVSLERWRQKEVHDILVECAQFSLDLTEGSTTEMSIPGPQRITEQSRSTPKLFQNLSELMTPSPGSLVGNVDSSMVMTSGQQGSGVKTPPLAQSSEPQTNLHGISSSTSGQQAAAQESPVAEEKHVKANKRLSQTGLSLAGKMPSSADVSPLYPDHCSIPPSPLRPDFSSEPPLHAPQKQTIRKLSFQQMDANIRVAEKITGPTVKLLQQPSTARLSTDQLQARAVAPSQGSSGTKILTSAEVKAASTAPPGGSMTSRETTSTQPDQPTEGAADTNISTRRPTSLDNSPEKVLAPGGTSTVPSLTHLPKFLDALDNQPEDTDAEVTELTSDSTADGVELTSDATTDGAEEADFYSEDSDTPSHLPTPASVAALMKKINRIRFNSINVSADRIETITKTRVRPRSCPNLEVHPDKEKAEPKAKDEDSLASFSIESPSVSLSIEEKKVEKIMRSSSSQTSLYALSSALLKTTSNKVIITDSTGTETEAVEREFPVDNFPYRELFCMALPFSPFIQCYTCTQKQTLQSDRRNSRARTQPALDDVRPLYAMCSPVELLDCLLDKSAESHHRASAGLSPGGHTHIPDLSSCNDVMILRGQIEMLHHQLLYERHKREVHAQRNRRLLSRTVKTTALEEQNQAMRDQLQLQERELTSLRLELQSQHRLSQNLQHTTVAHEAEMEKTQKIYRQKVEALGTKNNNLETQLLAAKKEKNKLHKGLQGYQAEVHSLGTEVLALKHETETTKELQEQVKRLNKELLLMGEIQERYQSRLVAHTMSESSSIHTQFLLDTYKKQLHGAKNSLTEKIVQLEAAESRLTAANDAVKRKDKALLEQKQMIETARDTYREEQKSVEDKYDSLKKVHLALQTEFLNVNEQIGRLEAAALRASRQRAATDARQKRRAEDGASIVEGSKSEMCLGGENTNNCITTDGTHCQDTPNSTRAPTSESEVQIARHTPSVDPSSQ